eukprot:gene6108-biopygen6136
MKHQQEAHDAAMKIKQAESKQHDLQAQLLTEQISAMRADAEKARSAKEDTEATTSTGDVELEKLRRLPYCPFATGNPFPPRPDTLLDAMPKLFDLYGDKTHAALCKKSNSSMKYEQMVLGPALAYFHDAIVYEETTIDLLQNLPTAEHTPFLNELWNRVIRGHNTKKGVYGLLCNRYTMIGYRAMLEGDNEAHGGAEVVRAKLAFMEQKIYAGTEGVVADTILTKWLAEFDASKAKNVMTVTAKLAAGAATRAQRGDHRVGGPPPDFDHGTSLRDLTQQKQEWLDIETARSLKTGAWVRARRKRHVSRVFLVPKPGTNSWRLVMDFRWLDEFCVKSKCKMETLKKLRRLARQGDEEINKPEEELRLGCKIEVFWPEDQVWYPGIMGATWEDGRTKIQYDDGDEENVVLKEEKYRVFPSENEEEDPQQQVTATPWKTVLLKHWTEKLGRNQHSDTAAAMQAAALEKSTTDSYERHWKKFVKFCTEENLRCLPATAATVQLYMASLQEAGLEQSPAE